MPYYNPSDVLLDLFRANMTDPNVNRVAKKTALTQTFSGDGSTTEFVLSDIPSGNLLSYISSVSISSVSQAKWDKFYIDFKKNKIVFKTAPTNASNNVSVDLYYTSEDFTYFFIIGPPW